MIRWGCCNDRVNDGMNAASFLDRQIDRQAGSQTQTDRPTRRMCARERTLQKLIVRREVGNTWVDFQRGLNRDGGMVGGEQLQRSTSACYRLHVIKISVLHAGLGEGAPHQHHSYLLITVPLHPRHQHTTGLWCI